MSLCERAKRELGPGPSTQPVRQFWVLMYDPQFDRQHVRDVEAVGSPQAMTLAGERNPTFEIIAAGLARQKPHSAAETRDDV